MAELPSTDAPIVATMTISADGWFQAVSPSFLELIQRPIEALAGLNLIDLVHPLDAAGARDLVARAAAGEAVGAVDLRLWADGDRWQPLRVMLRGVGDGRVILDAEPVGPAGVVAPDPFTATRSPTNAVPNAGPDPDSALDLAPDPDPAPESDDAEGDASRGQWAVDGERAAYRAAVPGPEVAMQRAAIRARAGGAGVPMIEIDQRGRTTFVQGDWTSLVDRDVTGVDAFEQLLISASRADEVSDAIADALDERREGRVEVHVAGHGRRWVHVLAMPSPHRSLVTHALIAVSPHADLPELDVTAVEPPPVMSSRRVPPGAIEALGRITGTTAAKTAVPGAELPAAPRGAAATGMATSDRPATDSARMREAAFSLLTRLTPVRDRVASRGLSWPQVGAAAGVIVLALVLRTWDLTTLPTGFHGDEGITGQEAERVLDQGSIGVYTGSALGQPTAPFYLNAIAVAFFGNTIWATRIVAAIAGVLTVGATYLIVQRRFDHRVALAASLAVATMTWTIHFSRIAFGIAWWPLVTLLAIAAIDRATTEGTPRSWFIAGGVSMFGVYVYNSHWTFGVGVVGFMVAWFFWRHERPVERRVRTLVWGPIGALVIGLPMLLFALDDKNGFFNHFDLVSRRNTPEWADAGLFGKVDLFIDWYIQAWDVLFWNYASDGVDASGVIRQVPLVFSALAAIGLIQVLRKHRTAFMGMVLVTIVVMPIVPAFTFDGTARRDYAMAPCVAIVAGIGAVALFDLVRERFTAQTARYVAAGLAAVVFFSSIVPYFTTFRNHPGQKWVFAEELVTAVDAVERAERDGPVFVNWFSGRHYFDYPTLAFLLDDVAGANRTPLDQGYVQGPALELTAGVAEDQLYVFIGDYADNLDRLRTMFPDGDLVMNRQTAPRVVAYRVPASQTS